MSPGVVCVGVLAVLGLLGLLVGGGPELGRPAPTPEARAAPLAAQRTAQPRQLAVLWGRAFASWNQGSLARRLRRLAGTATPPLAAELKRSAAAAERTDTSAGAEGSIASIAVQRDGPKRRLLVVTNETPLAAAGRQIGAARYVVYVGTLVRTAGGWRMDSWERQP